MVSLPIAAAVMMPLQDLGNQEIWARFPILLAAV
jgi:hypothetical protein